MSNESVEKALETVAKLRDPKDGCPWDLRQDHDSLLPYFFEELHEFAESLKTVGPGHPHTHEELGDVLFQVFIHAQLMSEKGTADFNKICDIMSEKLLNRHPHVFDPTFPKFKSPEEVNRAWEEIKAYAKSKKPAHALPPPPAGTPSGPAATQLRGTPRSLPALQRSARVGEKAASWGFDWPEAPAVWDKVREEVAECEAALTPAEEREELGDLLFAIAQYARKKGFDPEDLLNRANDKFIGRFAKMEDLVCRDGRPLKAVTLVEMEAAWTQIKK